ncbi:MAG: pitrilysin family protein [Bacteroidales bacterium]|jgi:predicted Zn-dependent peptidase
MVTFENIKLNNGLTVLVHRDRHTPIVAMNLIYQVGSRNEDPGRTGFAHLFEHLMFGGSVNVPKYDIPLERAGGENNAFTNADYTNYYLTLPKNNLETAFWLESDRMLGLEFSQRSLDVQKQVVIEEFKQNYLNQPYGDVYLLLKPLAYKKHPYRWNTIGREISHIEGANLDDVKDFYHQHYNPDNAILSVAGDVYPDDVFKLAEQWFGPLPAGNITVQPYPREPEQLEPRRLSVSRNVPQNAIYMAWHMPARRDPAYYTTDLISDVLSNGHSARLYQHLVKESKLFTELNAFISGDIDSGLFIITGKLMNGISMEEAEAAIWTELNRLTTDLITEEELKKIKNKIEANLIFARMPVLNKAMNLGYFHMLGDADDWNREAEKYQRVTRADIVEQARTMLVPSKQNTLTYYADNK